MELVVLEELLEERVREEERAGLALARSLDALEMLRKRRAACLAARVHSVGTTQASLLAYEDDHVRAIGGVLSAAQHAVEGELVQTRERLAEARLARLAMERLLERRRVTARFRAAAAQARELDEQNLTRRSGFVQEGRMTPP